MHMSNKPDFLSIILFALDNGLSAVVKGVVDWINGVHVHACGGGAFAG